MAGLRNFNTTPDIYLEFNVKGLKNFEDKPEKCHICGFSDIGSVELLGVKDGPFFWECDRCSSRFLRYTHRETQKLLKRAEHLYYDLEELDTIHLGAPN
tara:strand:+ start:542 stop:838 length:297 start_codon:yes stop_codon:yes gene_type:complete